MVNFVDFATHFIEPMEAIHGRMGRSGQEQQRAHQIWFHKLKEHSLDHIKQASDHYMEQEERKFPSLGEVMKYLDGKKAAANYVEHKREDPLEWERKADDFMQCQLAQTAMREGWGYCLWCTIKAEKKTSFSEAEIAEFRRIYKADVQSIIDLGAGRGEWSKTPYQVRKDGVRLLATQWACNQQLAGRFLKEGSPPEVPEIKVAFKKDEPLLDEQQGFSHVGNSL